MAGIGSGILKKWRDSTFRSESESESESEPESESESEKLTQKKDRNPEFHGIPPGFPNQGLLFGSMVDVAMESEGKAAGGRVAVGSGSS